MSAVLVVCTGNICRSPMAEGALRHLLEERGVPDVPVESAGTSGLTGSPPAWEAVEALAEDGIDISRHRAQALTAEAVLRADLIVCMTEDHAATARDLAPPAAGRIFTLKEFVRLLDDPSTGAHATRAGVAPPGPERLRDAVGRADRARRAGAVAGLADRDVSDPLGLGPQAFRAAAWEIGELCRRLVDGVFGSPASGSGADEGVRGVRGGAR